MSSAARDPAPLDFIRELVQSDLDTGKHAGVLTRFPPEPNGYLHLGHAKSICLNFGLAQEQDGVCYLRFDDTNPTKEDQRFVDAIQADIKWLGFDWGDRLTYASDYFERIYQLAEELIEKGVAYVDSQDAETIRLMRGSLTEPGKPSPYRDRTVAENLELFRAMRAGEYPDGAHVLRARIDMAAGNVHMRDPVLYRIRHVSHQRTGDTWCIYPMYDFTHCLCDAFEGITHSLCTLEFEDHRPLYDWVLDQVQMNARPQQIEFSPLGLEYMVLSKRFYSGLIDSGLLDGWDDPRLPTLAGLRRRGITPGAIQEFCRRIGVTRQDNTVEMALLEFCIRGDLEASAPRGMVVLEPLRVVLTNFPAAPETMTAAWHPKEPALGQRDIPFASELFIERTDFQETPEKGFKRLTLGGDVRLRYGYIIRCDRVERNAAGDIETLYCEYYHDSKSGQDTSGRKPKGVIHWVAAETAVPATVRHFSPLFTEVRPDPERLEETLATDSIQTFAALIEPALASAAPESHWQFERQGYYYQDPKDSKPGAPVFHRTVTLRDGFKPPS